MADAFDFDTAGAELSLTLFQVNLYFFDSSELSLAPFRFIANIFLSKMFFGYWESAIFSVVPLVAPYFLVALNHHSHAFPEVENFEARFSSRVFCLWLC